MLQKSCSPSLECTEPSSSCTSLCRLWKKEDLTSSAGSVGVDLHICSLDWTNVELWLKSPISAGSRESSPTGLASFGYVICLRPTGWEAALRGCRAAQRWCAEGRAACSPLGDIKSDWGFRQTNRELMRGPLHLLWLTPSGMCHHFWAKKLH